LIPRAPGCIDLLTDPASTLCAGDRKREPRVDLTYIALMAVLSITSFCLVVPLRTLRRGSSGK
jgi:hypothetical protein